MTWEKQRKIWHVQLRIKGGKRKFGGSFKDEIDAGKRVNQLCEELGILPQNPAITAIPNQQYQVTKKLFLSHCESIKIVKIYFCNTFCLNAKLCFKLNILNFAPIKKNLSWM